MSNTMSRHRPMSHANRIGGYVRKVLLGFLFAVALPLGAQQATLTTPETLTGTVAKLLTAGFDRQGGTLAVEIQANDGTVKRTLVYTTTSPAEFVSLLAAMGTSRATETGSAPRKMQFRVLGWMADNGKFTGPDGQPITVTVVP